MAESDTHNSGYVENHLAMQNHEAEMVRNQRLSALAESAIKNMPIDETASPEERAYAHQVAEETRLEAGKFVAQQLAVLKALELIPADADSTHVTPTIKQQALEKCQTLFGQHEPLPLPDPEI